MERHELPVIRSTGPADEMCHVRTPVNTSCICTLGRQSVLRDVFAKEEHSLLSAFVFVRDDGRSVCVAWSTFHGPCKTSCCGYRDSGPFCLNKTGKCNARQRPLHRYWGRGGRKPTFRAATWGPASHPCSHPRHGWSAKSPHLVVGLRAGAHGCQTRLSWGTGGTFVDGAFQSCSWFGEGMFRMEALAGSTWSHWKDLPVSEKHRRRNCKQAGGGVSFLARRGGVLPLGLGASVLAGVQLSVWGSQPALSASCGLGCCPPVGTFRKLPGQQAAEVPWTPGISLVGSQ